MPFVKFSPSPKPSNSALSTRHVLAYLIFRVFCLNTPCLGVLPTAWEDSWPGRCHTIELSHSLIVELLLKWWLRRTWPKIFCMENTTTLLFTTNGSVDSRPEALQTSDHFPCPPLTRPGRGRALWAQGLSLPDGRHLNGEPPSAQLRWLRLHRNQLWHLSSNCHRDFFFFFYSEVSLQPIRPEREQQKGSISEAKYFVLPKMNNIWDCRLLIPGISQVLLSGSFWLYELITSGEVIFTHMPSGVIIHLND